MGEFHIVHNKSGGDGFSVLQRPVPVPEEGDLVTKRPPIRRFQISGEIPPFGAELVVRKMVSRKSNLITWDSDSPPLLVCFPGQNCSNGQEQDQTGADQVLHVSILME